MEIRPAAIIFDEQGRILLMHYRYSGNDVYNFPGGRLESGETMSLALQREMEEELGIVIEVGELLVVGEVILPEKNNKTTLHCLFAARLISGTPTPNPEQTKALAAIWLPVPTLETVSLYPNVGNFVRQHHYNIATTTNNSTSSSPVTAYIGRIEQVWY